MTQTPFAVNVPINSLSFGQSSVAILRELYKRGLTPPVMPIAGNLDLGAQRPEQGFTQWLSNMVGSADARHSREHQALKLWHIGGSLDSVSRHSNHLITFQETGQLTPLEVNVLRQQRKVFVTNRYAQTFFRLHGIDAVFLPLGFDSANFSSLERRPHIDGVISFSLVGKAESIRKHTYKQLALWAARYGNDKRYRLNAYITNPFLAQRNIDPNALISQALGGKRYWNIEFHPFIPTNLEYNTALQSSEVVLAMSGSEGFGLPEFHAAALGAWPVALNAHAYKDHFGAANAVMVEPNGMVPIYDGIHFHQGAPVNQGVAYSWSDEAFYAGCEEAVRRAKVGINTEGLKLQQQTYSQTVDILLREIGT